MGGGSLAKEADSDYSLSALAVQAGSEINDFRFPDHVENVDDSEMTLEIAINGANFDISIYKDAAKTILMSQAINIASGAFFQTTAQAGYRIILTGNLAAPPTPGDYPIVMKSARLLWADRPLDYFTLAIDDKIKKLTFGNCWTQLLRLAADGRTSIRVEEQVIAMTLDEEDSDLTALILDNDFLAVRGLELIYDQAADNFSLPVEGGVMSQWEYETSAGPDNNDHPEFFDREEPMLTGSVNAMPSDQTQAILARARASEFRELLWLLSYGDFGVRVTWPAALFDGNVLPRGSGKRMEALTMGWDSRADQEAPIVEAATVYMDYHA
jgi:hypothetical protein